MLLFLIGSLSRSLSFAFFFIAFCASVFHANNQLRGIIYAKMSANSICTMFHIPSEALTNYRIVSQHRGRVASIHIFESLLSLLCSTASICVEAHKLANSVYKHTDTLYTCVVLTFFVCTSVLYSVHVSVQHLASQVILRRSSIEYQ